MQFMIYCFSYFIINAVWFYFYIILSIVLFNLKAFHIYFFKSKNSLKLLFYHIFFILNVYQLTKTNDNNTNFEKIHITT